MASMYLGFRVWAYIGLLLGSYRMEKRIETTIMGLYRVWGLGFRVWGYAGGYMGHVGIMEKRMEPIIIGLYTVGFRIWG